jgi:hypothetical protein
MLMRTGNVKLTTRWPEEWIEEIRPLYGVESASVVAERYGVSRNAIIGVWNRAREAGILEPIDWGKRTKPKGVERKPRQRKPRPEAAERPKNAPPKEIPLSGQAPVLIRGRAHPGKRAHAQIHCEPVGLLDAKIDHCRYIIGNGAGGLATFCGAHVEAGRSWCPGHARIVFSPLEDQPKSIRKALS